MLRIHGWVVSSTLISVQYKLNCFLRGQKILKVDGVVTRLIGEYKISEEKTDMIIDINIDCKLQQSVW